MKPIFLSFLLVLMIISQSVFAADDIEKPHHARHSHSKSHSMKPGDRPVDINNAGVTELSTLKGIGEKKAEAIIEYRNVHGSFQSIDDLAKVKGIGLKMLARLKKNNPGRITVSNTPQNLTVGKFQS